MTEQRSDRMVILRRKQVQERTGLSRSTIYLRITQGNPPKPSRLEPVPVAG